MPLSFSQLISVLQGRVVPGWPRGAQDIRASVLVLLYIVDQFWQCELLLYGVSLLEYESYFELAGYLGGENGRKRENYRCRTQKSTIAGRRIVRNLINTEMMANNGSALDCQSYASRSIYFIYLFVLLVLLPVQ